MGQKAIKGHKMGSGGGLFKVCDSSKSLREFNREELLLKRS